jgi:hypothetical protein
MGYGRLEKIFWPPPRGPSQRLCGSYHHPLSSLTFAKPPDPAMGMFIARIWFSERKMSTISTLALSRLFSAPRRAPPASRNFSRQQGASGGRKRVHLHAEFDRRAVNLGTSRQRNPPLISAMWTNRRKSSVLHSTFADSRPLTSGSGAIAERS